MKNIRKGDEVIVIAGKDKGRRGTVLRVEGDRVAVENVNVVKKHQKPNPGKNVPGGIVEREASLHLSNVMLFNPVTKKGDRVGVKALENGRRVRVFRSNNEVVDI
ncbi:MAG: 50S ribosomal protein L24 [Gammaproteobacteria bacterium]|jgi:large subunit ribosomal protein L24|nr:MAG: 50S ribosomal protein L24 [Pseudomonadota bacterium]MBC6945640.1 50S ribosomal protein L24 [Gammaproteobacteria bacterium]MCE7896315.1 50S ribosomal protein L24 [Gammaproteobacteria bacterium PRO8]MDL1881860.1 50S ribosomal protein L24 [Gammaproteobacteria bacterium PRO2]MCL4777860.1 50S ribosomal protein L24 [Gammaproteobacteria bacterium]